MTALQTAAVWVIRTIEDGGPDAVILASFLLFQVIVSRQ
jgi:hypothetical protein